MIALSGRLLRVPAFGANVAERIVQFRPVIEQLVRYTGVSALALALDFAVFMLLTRFDVMSAALAGATGYGTGLVLHYALSVRLVFDASASLKTRRRLFTEFAASGIFGVFTTWSVIHLAVGMLGIGSLAAKGLAVLFSFAAVFMIRRSIIFAARP